MRLGRPVPTRRAVSVAAAGLALTALGVLWPAALPWALAADAALLTLIAVDYLRAPKPDALRVSRQAPSLLSAGVANRVHLVLSARPGDERRFTGEVRDVVTAGPSLEGQRQRIDFAGEAALGYLVKPATRGDLTLGPAWVRLEGPLGLCARQASVGAATPVRVYPDLTALGAEALALARPSEAAARRRPQVRGGGREFDALREYRPGDDRRSVDWKATARRARPMVRVHRPERDQQVLVLLDCGRHMAGAVDGRRKLDFTVDATLRLAHVSLRAGDAVGVLAYGARVQAFLPPRKGGEQLAAIAHALYRVEARLEESDLDAALTLAFARGTRRSLVLLMTDLLDADSAEALARRTRLLAPRHLPLVASLRDEALHREATRWPDDAHAALRRFTASRLEDEVQTTMARLREGGARVLRAPARDFGAATVGAYLDVKARGAL